MYYILLSDHFQWHWLRLLHFSQSLRIHSKQELMHPDLFIELDVIRKISVIQ